MLCLKCFQRNAVSILLRNFIVDSALQSFHAPMPLMYSMVLCMLACWVEDPNNDCFKKHLARIPDYLRVAEDGTKMQGLGSQIWDTAFAMQALLACEMNDDISDTLRKGYDFIKKSQVKDNPSGDFRGMYWHISHFFI